MLGIIEKNYTEFNSNVKEQLAIIHVLENKHISPVDKVNKYLYQQIINRFEVGERYTSAKIRETINEVCSKYNHIKVPGKNCTHFFRMLIVAKRDKKGQYKIICPMMLKEFC